MRNLEFNEMESLVGGQNCGGIYNACIIASGVAGMAGVLATAGVGVFVAVAAATAAMEYCRQQAIGCYETAPNGG